jgi:hypothetical protein
MYVFIKKKKSLLSNNAIQLSFYVLGEMRNIILRSTNLKFPFHIPAAKATLMAKLLDITVIYYNNFISSNSFWNPVGNARYLLIWTLITF